MTKFVSFLLLLIPCCVHSQIKYDHQWLFGYGAPTQNQGGSVLSFNTTPPDTFRQERPMNFDATNASMCDQNGNLLFYTNGISIYNSFHQIMENGDNLSPGELTSDWTSKGLPMIQGVLLIPKPESENLYYLFHEKGEYPISSDLSLHSSVLYYSVIDINQNNGLGSVITKNVNLLEETLQLGVINATKHANGRDWWIIVREYASNSYYRFLLDPDGVKEMGRQQLSGFFPAGLSQAVFSPDGNKFAYFTLSNISDDNNLSLYDFDRCSGLFSNNILINFIDSAWSCGVAFSPNSRFLYVSSYNYIYQYDMQATDIPASKDTVAVYDGYLEYIWDNFYLSTRFFLAQLAPDGKIYLNSYNGVKAMHVINQPDLPGESCDVAQHSITLPTWNAVSLPNFPNYRLGPLEGSPCDTLTTATKEASAGNTSLHIWPNPASDFIMADASLPSYNPHQQAELLLLDQLGQIVRSHTLSPFSTIHRFETVGLAAGIYFVVLKYEGEVAAVRKVGVVR